MATTMTNDPLVFILFITDDDRLWGAFQKLKLTIIGSNLDFEVVSDH